MAREVIINADDFGLSSGVNKAVVEGWRSGILTSASLMPGGKAFLEAVELARENPGLQVGLHLTLVQGRAVLPPEVIPGLVDDHGYFTNNPVAAGMRYFFLKSLRPQLEREIEAQILAVKEQGLPLSHIDGHLNIHMQPVVFDILTRLMPKYGITTFRVTQEDFAANLAVDPVRKTGKRFDALIFSQLARRCRPVLDRLQIGYGGEVRGLLTSGRMRSGYLVECLKTLSQQLTEIYFHPGCHPCGEIRHWMPDYNHEEELAALLSPEVKRVLKDEQIVLRNYRGEVKRVRC